jgi:predicted small lipoprotein YifL
MRFFPLRFFFLLFTLLALAGCGKKGALYLPDAAPVAGPVAPITQPVEK